MPGVKSAAVALTTQRGVFKYDSTYTGPRFIIAAINQLGFSASLAEADKTVSPYDHADMKNKWMKSFLLALVFTIPLFIIMILPHVCTLCDRANGCQDGYLNQPIILPGLSQRNFILFLMSTPVMLIVGRPFYVSGIKALLHHAANMDTLIVLGTG
jgi:cation transport ATPase